MMHIQLSDHVTYSRLIRFVIPSVAIAAGVTNMVLDAQFIAVFQWA